MNNYLTTSILQLSFQPLRYVFTLKDIAVVMKLASLEETRGPALRGIEILRISQPMVSAQSRGQLLFNWQWKKYAFSSREPPAQGHERETYSCIGCFYNFLPSRAYSSRYHYFWYIGYNIRIPNYIERCFFKDVSKIYEGTPTIYQSIEHLKGDPGPLKNQGELTQVVSILCHLDELGKEKSAYIE